MTPLIGTLTFLKRPLFLTPLFFVSACLHQTSTHLSTPLSTDAILIQEAQDNQRDGGRYNADTWIIRRLKKGEYVYDALPGQSAYYTTRETLKRAHCNNVHYAHLLQIAPNPTLGFRKNIGVLTMENDVHVPFGFAYANPTYGPGGGEQMFIKDYATTLKLDQDISIDTTFTPEECAALFKKEHPSP